MVQNQYCISDIHGDYDRFVKMLQKIKFCSTDKLYIVGDIFDRGGKPLEVYKEIVQHENIIPILGNHDLWLADYIAKYLKGERVGRYPYNSFELLKRQFSVNILREVLEWIKTLPSYLIVTVNDQKFMLAHARSFEKPEQVPEYNLIMSEIDYQYLKRGVDGYISVIGHVPTNSIRYWVGEALEKKNTIWTNSRKNVFCIDCGCGFRDAQSQLGCLRLNDFKCFYV